LAIITALRICYKYLL